MQLNQITERIIGCAFEVHRELGPGLLESAYEPCLEWELRQNGLHVRRQVVVPVVYKGIEVKSDYRIDLLVEEQVVVEVKAVNKIEAVMPAQVITYLKLTGLKVGLLINFKVRWLKTGIERIVYNYTPEERGVRLEPQIGKIR